MRKLTKAQRQAVREIEQSMASMVASQTRILDTCGWDDPRLEAIDDDLRAAQAARTKVLGLVTKRQAA